MNMDRSTGGQPMSLESLFAQGYQTVTLDESAAEVGSEAIAESLNPNVGGMRQDVNQAQAGQEEFDTQQVADSESDAASLTTSQQGTALPEENQLIAELQAQLAQVRNEANTAQQLLVQIGRAHV